MAARAGSASRAASIVVATLLAPSVLAFRTGLEVDGAAGAPPPVRRLSERVVVALTSSSGGLGAAVTRAVRAASAARFPSSVNGEDQGARQVHAFERDASKILGAHALKNHISFDAWHELETASVDASRNGLEPMAKEHLNYLKKVAAGDVEKVSRQRHLLDAWAQETKEAQIDLASLGGGHGNTRVSSLTPGVAGASARYFSTAAKGDFQPLTKSGQVHDKNAMDLVEQFLLEHKRTIAVSSAWLAWRDFKVDSLPLELQNAEVVDAIEGAFVFAVATYPEIVELAKGTLRGFIIKAKYEDEHQRDVTRYLDNWTSQCYIMRDSLLRWTSLDKREAARFGRWVRARMLLEQVRSGMDDPPAALRALEETLAFAAARQADQEEVLRELDLLRGDMLRDTKQGGLQSAEDRSERVHRTILSLRHLAGEDGTLTGAL